MNDETAPRIQVRNPDEPIFQAIYELEALASSRRANSYVTETTRATVRRVTGLEISPAVFWTRNDVAVATAALRESVS